MFFSMSGYIFARYGYHLKLSENGGFRSLESQINSFNEKYSNVPQEINKFIINANKYNATKYLSEDSTFRDNITKPENKLVFIKALNPKSLIEEAQEVLMNLISVNGIFNVFLTKTKEL